MPPDRAHSRGGSQGETVPLTNGGNRIHVLLDAVSGWVPPPEGLDKHPPIIIPESSAIIQSAVSNNCRISSLPLWAYSGSSRSSAGIANSRHRGG